MFTKLVNIFYNKATLKYLAVGIGTIALDFFTIFICYTVFEVYYITSIVLGFIVSNIFQFYANFFFTFELKKELALKKRAVMYVISIFIAMGLGTVTIILLENFINNLYISKAISLIVNFLYGFFASKYVVFNKNLKF